MGTKNNPGKFDCYANAAPDEPMFVLLARDPHAHLAVADWCERRERLIRLGEKPESDIALVEEGKQCIQAMREWRKANRP